MAPVKAPSRKALSLKARALQALALREHSRTELRAKLLRWHAPIADPTSDGPDGTREIDALLDDFEARGWLSPQRFIESRVHARAARFGNRRIEAELAQHGLTLDEPTAAELQRTEIDRARAVWARRFGPDATGRRSSPSGAEPQTAAEQARQMRFLAARGFSPEVVRRVVRGAPDD